jgi:hypothetical protein
MARKPTETKNYTHHPQSKSNEVDITQPGVIHIDEEPYFVDGVVARFILELLDEIEMQKEQLKTLESYMGEHGKA